MIIFVFVLDTRDTLKSYRTMSHFEKDVRLGEVFLFLLLLVDGVSFLVKNGLKFKGYVLRRLREGENAGA